VNSALRCHIEPFIWRHGRACPGHPRLSCRKPARKTWMPATSAGMTAERSFNLIGAALRVGPPSSSPRRRRTGNKNFQLGNRVERTNNPFPSAPGRLRFEASGPIDQAVAHRRW
jgi:hypothetical protein